MIRIIVPGTISDVTISADARRGARGAPARGLVRGAAHVVGDVVERLRQRHAELLGLQLGGDEAAERLGRVALAQRQERLRGGSRRAPSGAARSASPRRPGRRATPRRAPARPVAEAGAHGHGEDVEEVRQVALDPLLAHAALAREPDVGAEPAEQAARAQQQRRAAGQHEQRDEPPSSASSAAL